MSCGSGGELAQPPATRGVPPAVRGVETAGVTAASFMSGGEFSQIPERHPTARMLQAGI